MSLMTSGSGSFEKNHLDALTFATTNQAWI